MKRSLRILAFGAHPDDCEFKAAGSAIVWSRAGHQVKFVSVTDGRSGHHEMDPQSLIARRAGEAAAAAKALGVESEILPFPDGSLEPSLALRHEILRVERSWKPDVVLTHRLNDYHPDHRYTSQAVQDAAYMVAVPHVAPEFPALRHNPAVFYFSDRFSRPYPFSPDAFVPVDEILKQKTRALDCHESQVYEWLPFVAGATNDIPSEPDRRRDYLAHKIRQRDAAVADRFRERITQAFGPERGASIACVECFESCEYGGMLSEDDFQSLFGHARLD